MVYKWLVTCHRDADPDDDEDTGGMSVIGTFDTEEQAIAYIRKYPQSGWQYVRQMIHHCPSELDK